MATGLFSLACGDGRGGRGTGGIGGMIGTGGVGGSVVGGVGGMIGTGGVGGMIGTGGIGGSVVGGVDSAVALDAGVPDSADVREVAGDAGFESSRDADLDLGVSSGQGGSHADRDAAAMDVLDSGDSEVAAPACSSEGWCWEHGADATIAGLLGSARLTSVWSSGPNDQWAVGTLGTVLHKVGMSWSSVDLLSNESFNGIWGTSPDDVWIVGSSGTILHKDGSDWFRVIVPTTKSLNAIWGSAPDDFWIVGDGGTILHRVGASWFTVNSGTTSALRGGWGSSADNVWAVGDFGTILHWDGRSGSPSSSGIFDNLVAVGGTGPDDAWTVGRDGMILHWNGTGWSPFASNAFAEPAPAATTLTGIWARRKDDAWAVGLGGLVLHWNGSRWARGDSGTTRDLFAVRAEADGTVWAAGDGEGILRRSALGPGGDTVRDGGLPNDGFVVTFEPPPSNCHPTMVLRFFSAGPSNIEGVGSVIVKLERPGMTSTYNLNGPGVVYAYGGVGVSFCVIDGSQGVETMTVELQLADLSHCLLGAVTTTATVLDDVTAMDFVFAPGSCTPDAGT